VNENELTSVQRGYLDAFTARYVERTKGSKQHERSYRPVFADFRALVVFRMATKEMCYPIAVVSGKGSKIQDVDDNIYTDYCMGFGVNLLGHQPEFITSVIEQQVRESLLVGPQSSLAGGVAELICKLTGVERVAFCNSGTEAVATALRVARAHSGRGRMALFAGTFHGHNDATLLVPSGQAHGAQPLVRGVYPKTVEETMVLPYGSQAALDTLKQQADTLGAILVEPLPKGPVQGDMSPREFILALREFSDASGVPLVFDEIFSGFRVHLGGAQAILGVQADLVTYGKVMGGGLPIGVVTGKKNFMDHLDGGSWDYGDTSYPKVEPTFSAGTFCKHPLAMVATHAMLTHLERQGPELQQGLNERTGKLMDRLNGYFENNGIIIRASYTGYSWFRFDLLEKPKNPRQVPFLLLLLQYHLLYKGIYTWEWGACVVSTAHTDEDHGGFYDAVVSSISELQAGGFSYTD
jgi:glutamate-1-semialdehyde aminotransferase